MISKATVEEFQNVVKKETGVSLNTSEAQKVLTDLVGYFDLLAKIDYRSKKPNQQYERKDR